MFKGFGLIGFGVFAALTWMLLGSSPGLGFIFGATVVTFLGWGSVLMMTLPDGFFSSIWKQVEMGLPQSASALARQIEAVSLLIRQDGLLALEAKRKEIKDQNLSYLLKRIMDGFEAKELIPFIRNLGIHRAGQIGIASETLDRFFGLIPSVGLVGSLILISGVLTSSARGSNSIGIAFVFFPFLLSLATQVILESHFAKKLRERQMESELYFSVLEEGVSGIQQGINPELLSDRIKARIQAGSKWLNG